MMCYYFDVQCNLFSWTGMSCHFAAEYTEENSESQFNFFSYLFVIYVCFLNSSLYMKLFTSEITVYITLICELNSLSSLSINLHENGIYILEARSKRKYLHLLKHDNWDCELLFAFQALWTCSECYSIVCTKPL